MPLTTLTCPICLCTLKPKTAVHEGARIRCPKCKGSFVVESAPSAPAAAPQEAIRAELQQPMPAPPDAELPEAQEVLEDEILEAEPAEAPAAPGRSRADRDDEYDRPRRRSSRRDEEEEERGSRFRKKKGVPPWVWLVSGGVGLVLLLGCCGVAGIFGWMWFGGMSVNMDNYNKIQGRMTQAQVQQIMGTPSESGGMPGFESEAWKSGDSIITVTFVNGKAAGKACHLHYGAATVDRTDLLGP
ncbi:MAG TPA: hypothetical protein VMS17_16475 [Gemmataceae bacterium]|nr:hypothetical protein [Gemmataceae bacterium]